MCHECRHEPASRPPRRRGRPRRNRLTVFFRIILAIPHFIWIMLWTIAVIFAGDRQLGRDADPGTAARGAAPIPLAYMRYTVHLNAYLYLVGEPVPGVRRRGGRIPGGRRLPPPSRGAGAGRRSSGSSSRIPALAPLRRARRRRRHRARRRRGAPGRTAAAAAARSTLSCASSAGSPRSRPGRMPQGPARRGRLQHRLRRAGARVPAARHRPLPERGPDGDARRRRAAAAASRAARRRRARPAPLAPDRLLPAAARDPASRLAVPVDDRRVLSRRSSTGSRRCSPARRRASCTGSSRAYVRYALHVNAFLYARREPVPGLHRRAGTLPARPRSAREPERQNRWKTGFRIILAIPAWIVDVALGWALAVAAFFTWFVALLRGSAPWGLRNLSAYALRYGAQMNAYVYLLTDAYPHASPLEGEPPRDAAASTNRRERCAAWRAARRARGGLGARGVAALAVERRRVLQPAAPRSARRYFARAQLHRAASLQRASATLSGCATTVAQLVVLGRVRALRRPLRRASRRPGRSAPGCCSACSASPSSGSRRCRSACSRSGGGAATTDAGGYVEVTSGTGSRSASSSSSSASRSRSSWVSRAGSATGGGCRPRRASSA